jgi:hypothetical protein
MIISNPHKMKIVVNILALFFLIELFSCERKQNEAVVQKLICSDCKSNGKTSDASETVHFKFISSDEMLVEHNNVHFNCEPGKISVTGQIDQNHVSIYEHEEKHNADCICPYDLSFRITGLKTGENTIAVYLMDYKKLECSIYFNNTTDTIIQIQN